MIESCQTYYVNDNPEYAIICLPGRAGNGAVFARDYLDDTRITNAVFVGPTPVGYEWYPMPVSAMNQAAALGGLPRARSAVERIQKAVEKKFGIPKSKTVLTGFSAGGVMAIQAAAYSEEPYLAAVCHCGAILEPEDLPEANGRTTPILLTHNRDDMCFEWFERYIPMKSALLKKGYRTFVLEGKSGGHYVEETVVQETLHFLSHQVKMELEIDETYAKSLQ